MIEIDWSFDEEFLLYPDIINKVPERGTGIYFLYDSNKKLMYIGISTYLRKRLLQHFNGGSSNTAAHSNDFTYCSVIYESDSYLRGLFEIYFIQMYKPPFNTSRNPKSTCKGVRNDGGKCGMFAGKSGYCRHHAEQIRSLKK